jgi:hypothetical protein
MVRLGRTIQQRLWPLKKSFINARQGVLDPPVKPEDDEGVGYRSSSLSNVNTPIFNIHDF